MTLAGRRYVDCRNLDQMAKDAADRATIVANLERQLPQRDFARAIKSLVPGSVEDQSGTVRGCAR